jgi:hypothetical protein
MVKLFNHEWSKVELLRRVGHMDQLAGIRLTEAKDGKARGCRILDVWTGSGLRFQINADRALDICHCDFQGQPLNWRSPSGDVHPAFYEPEGIGWLRSFAGGLIVTCGLDQFGSPSSEGGKELGLHGRISHCPATRVNYRTYWAGDDYKLEISGEIRQGMIFGENLVLQRKITTSLGSNKIRIDDSVTNEGFETAPHMLLYHCNMGFPLVNETTQLKLESKATLPRDDNAAKGLADWSHFMPPTPCFQEQVFIHQLAAGKDGMAVVELSNPAVHLGMRWTIDATTLPYLMEWKMMGEGSYIIGIEPANCNGLGGRAATREVGGLPVLKPGESRDYHMDLEVFTV